MIENDVAVRIAPDHVFTDLQCEGAPPAREPMDCNLTLRVHCFPNNLPDKSIAFAHDGFDESRPIYIVAERLSDFPHRSIDRGVVIEEHVRTPQRGMNVVANHE